MRSWGGDWSSDELELGFGSGDDGCVVGHLGCFLLRSRDTYRGWSIEDVVLISCRVLLRRSCLIGKILMIGIRS